ncbi:adenosylcobalamin-dependent ribonucleoside-diphosphate reductase [Pseudothermotoga thermarum]|uniref:Vitamin B12-dependent ribonucleotide reductase n=1 Tax=Pseudothermotoga thermarum DSM 5069 TaxID=688269 RepID=F7YUT4_9THEM|nr:adenosylcobalamin-dependent ribonucleoside-diphosphate reductase [Pseudothermotoga thermarum]AEH50274.1 ribonucleoside-diphosphate reductase, adenosylcobalamin-dependent [Pseudothermotoga thermarum DSM 5069]
MYRQLIERYKQKPLSENALKILKERYFFKKPSGEFVENSWFDVCRRVARVVAAAELINNPRLEKMTAAEKLDFVRQVESDFFDLLASRIFLPNSPTLFNAGIGADYELLYKPLEQMKLEDYQKILDSRNHLHMLSACFVVPVEDSIEGIFNAVKEFALITKAGGGIGSNFSALRPKGSFVAGTHGKASGPVSFMHVFNTAVSIVEQGYRRRGALMGILNIDHPDIMEFIDAKKGNDGERVLKFFNISVGIPMDRLEILRMYENDEEIELKHPKWHHPTKVKVREIFKKMAQNAWETGDPGMVFLGEMNKYYALYPYREIISTNPCGEIGLSAYEACNLGSIDLAKLCDDKGVFDWESFAKVIRTAVRFLDNVIDVNVFPIDKITQAVKESRRLGLGIMGFADMLYKMEIPYNSEQARSLAKNLMAFMALHAHEESSRLGQEKGNFPLFEYSRYPNGFIPFSMDVSDYDDEIREHFNTIAKKYKRNVAVLAIAPTGSISNIADTSSGLEPNFLLAYVRYVNKLSTNEREPLFYVNEVLAKKLPENELLRIRDRLIEEGSLRNIDIDERLKKIFVVAHDIDPLDHLLMQEAFQSYVDNNISKTINVPNSATVDDVLEIYVEALKHKIRGLTVYRDGSLQTQVLTSAKDLKTKEAPKVQFFILDEKKRLRARPRKETLRSVTRKYKTSAGTTYITVSFDDTGEAIEIFLSNGTETAEAIGRLASTALRAGVSVEEIIEQLLKVKGEYVRNVGLEIKKAIEDFATLWNLKQPVEHQIIHIDGTMKSPEEVEKFVLANKLEWQEGYYVDLDGNTYCPSCLSKNSLIRSEGCVSCKVCGWSKCS